jgi:hypothetical protein
MAENLALESAPMTQEPHRNQDSRGSGAHYFCHAKYTHVSQTLWRGLLRYFASQASVLSTIHLCRPSFSLLSMPFLAIRFFIRRFLKTPLHFLSS